MQILFRIFVLAIISLLGGLLYSLSVNVLIMTHVFPTEEVGNNFGYEMTSKAVLVWFAAIIIGFVSVFIEQKWRYLLLACPLLAPSIFALIYSLSLS